MSHRVKCRACGKYFDRDVLIEGIDWVLPSANQYYHKQCFEDWADKRDQLTTKMSNEEWFEALKYYLRYDVRLPIDYRKLNSQWNNFLKQKKTAKGIYLTVKYFYEYADGDKEKSLGGIGIVPYIYQDSCRFWEEKFIHDAAIIEKIERQAAAAARQKVNKVKQTKKETVKKRVFSLDDIE